ncbi:MAG TPA: hypothetical protein VID48_09565 [Solirubrobacteraceae bacterium]|jgi:hypothetical protein
MTRLATLALTASLIIGLAGCGHSAQPNPALPPTDLARQRADLLLVSHALRQAMPSVAAEVNGARAVWPLIAHGIPLTISGPLRGQVTAASLHTMQIKAPRFMVTPPRANSIGVLTGPGAGIAGLFQAFVNLTQQGWKLTAATIGEIESGPGSNARFLRSNASLYITCIYDGHFDLALVGKSLLDAYEKLGGAMAFGRSLTHTELENLADFYGEQLRLRPHSAYRLS